MRKAEITPAIEKILESIGIEIPTITDLPKDPKSHKSAAIIGTAGHVDHGKSTLAEALTGKFPSTHSEEILRGITIFLGYTHLDIYLCCRGNEKPVALTSNANKKCPPGAGRHHVRCYSVLDQPGHEILLSTMLAGASIIDYGLIVIAANEPCPMPQTREHTAALEAMGIKKIIAVQNKIELVDEKRLLESYQEIVEFFDKETSLGVPVIIPASAALRINVDLILAAILEHFTPMKSDTSGPTIMYVARSFDANRPGTSLDKLIGGVIGGALKSGELKVGDEIEIRPGIVTEEGEVIPLISEVASIRNDAGEFLEAAQPHMLIGVATNLDPALAKSDRLVGNIAGRPADLPDIVDKIIVKDIHMFERIVGARVEMKNYPLRKNEEIVISVGTTTVPGIVDSAQDDTAEIALRHPIAMPKGERVALLREIEREYRLVGYGRLYY
ncbi:MAG: translation initiation factor IF-2 subunit gamma [Candidatus Korarchaeota archaeon]|nr:translation initiation factor IF-2 subunit gamma [Thermoproteota archaeon]MCR8462812.1 translation initiation factor IF-2 subunit gamma [Thermoproteota archaeon]MCR8471367.1 translation initiation factor IF-2 subunit gamma [Thermoproteota archaeon]MCR8472511.1 translation initiation factor IF-2 subunit gamma [Thermoproteota archaeon]MCR8473629.1 translation initiation factor IF-2 subunit gamma [Thermoproteota archaeon]